MTTTRTITLADYIQRTRANGLFEVVDNEITPLAYNEWLHAKIIRRLFEKLYHHLKAHPHAKIFTKRAFILLDASSPQHVFKAFVPDMMIYTMRRWDHYTANTNNANEKPFMLVPDLAIEVVSQNEKPHTLHKKAQSYLADGVSVVWIIDPNNKSASIYQHGQAPHHSSRTLKGDPMLKGFQVALNKLM